MKNELVETIKKIYSNVDHAIGYPVCQYPNIAGFGEWYTKTGLCDIAINNVGNPFDGDQFILSSTELEQGLIGMFAPWYGIPEDQIWGVCYK